MARLKVFLKDDCPRCPEAKNLVDKLRKEGVHPLEYNVETIDGMAEGAFHSVMGTPAMLLVDSEDRLLAEWREHVPTSEEVKKEISRFSA